MGVVGSIIHSMLLHDIVEGAVLTSDVILDYTQYMTIECADIRIQRTWRKRRMIKAAKRISNAFQLWQIRRKELCFVGMVHLFIEINRAFKEEVIF